jgi:uncharacterized protein (TIGR00255 family)
MTAYARAAAREEYGELEWQLRSVNHRYLELSLRLPDALRSLEPAARETVARVLRRGKVDLALRHVPPASTLGAVLDEAALEAVVSAAHLVARRLEVPLAPPDPYAVLRLPGVLRGPDAPDSDALGSAALELLGSALDELVQTRRREGTRLAGLIRERAGACRAEVARVRTRLPQLADAYRTRLRERVAALGASVEPGRLEQEVVLLVQRSDPAEELDRLELHLDEVERTLGQDAAVGRRLDFLMQELTREANTLGSKSNDAEVTQAAVALKVLIEQMREQIQNVE